jgi:hypothetical protein
MKPVVFFDMDGVLADFVGGACRLHGSTLHFSPAAVQWDFCTQIGFNGPGDPAFWKPLESVDFWAGLEPLEDGMDLFRRVEAAIGAERIGILSSGLCPGSCDGKRAWLDKYLPIYAHAAVFCSRKWLIAAPNKLLLDDHMPNADGFVAAGGLSIVIPRPWNPRGSECHDGRFDAPALMGEVEKAIGA